MNPVDDWLLLRLMLAGLAWVLLGALVWATTWTRAPRGQGWTSRLAAFVTLTTLAMHLVPFAYARLALEGNYLHQVFIPRVHQLTLEPGLAFWLVGWFVLSRPRGWRAPAVVLVAAGLFAFITPVTWRLLAGDDVGPEVLRRSFDTFLASAPCWFAFAFAVPVLLAPLLAARRSVFFVAWTVVCFGVATGALLSLGVSWGPLRATMPEALAVLTPATWLAGVLARLAREVDAEAS